MQCSFALEPIVSEETMVSYPFEEGWSSLVLLFVDNRTVFQLSLTAEFVSRPFSSIDLDLIESKYAEAMAKTWFELAFVWKAIRIVEYSLPVSSALLTLTFVA